MRGSTVLKCYNMSISLKESWSKAGQKHYNVRVSIILGHTLCWLVVGVCLLYVLSVEATDFSLGFEGIVARMPVKLCIVVLAEQCWVGKLLLLEIFFSFVALWLLAVFLSYLICIHSCVIEIVAGLNSAVLFKLNYWMFYIFVIL